MKYIIAIVLLCLVLAGCGGEKVKQTVTTDTGEKVVVTGSPGSLDTDEIPAGYKQNLETSACRFSGSQGFVHQDGKLTFCSSDSSGKYAVGNIFEKGYGLWESEEFKRLAQMRRKLPMCRICGDEKVYVKKVKLKP